MTKGQSHFNDAWTFFSFLPLIFGDFDWLFDQHKHPTFESFLLYSPQSYIFSKNIAMLMQRVLIRKYAANWKSAKTSIFEK